MMQCGCAKRTVQMPRQRTPRVVTRVVGVNMCRFVLYTALALHCRDDVDELASFMKVNEMDGAKSVHFAFSQRFANVKPHRY
jgi:hypothetical protein